MGLVGKDAGADVRDRRFMFLFAVKILGLILSRMKLVRVLFFICCFGVAGCLACFAQGQDSLSVTVSMYGADDDFNLFLLTFALAAISFMIGVAIVGAGLAIFLLTLAAAFIGTGILSISVLVGLLKKSHTAAAKTMIYLVCALTAATAGAFGFWMIAVLFHLRLSSAASLLGGLLAGLLGGILWARISILLLGKAKKYFEGALLADGRH